ncbi:MAG: serine/threonine protein kinase [Phycisphaerales bacterium]|nr:MAG: serine/threonine protein kinase [Phycisphaerales bacterium]
MSTREPDVLGEAMQIFADIYDRPTEERQAEIAQRCAGRPDLQREVESLLRQHDEPKMLREEELEKCLQDAIGSASGRPVEDGVIETPSIARIGRYRIIRLIGAGGMGAVYEAEQERPRRRVAIKLIRPGWVTDALLKRFEREAHVLGQLDHPGIAQIYEADTAEAQDDQGRSLGRQPFFAMELVHGHSLHEYLERTRPSTSERLDLVRRIAEAVHHAHQKGIVHRDLKPNNILVTEEGRPKILDFGVARLTEHDAQVTTLQTQSGELVGTLAYMSPEQIAGDSRAVDTRADVYALGVILYEVLSERLPLDVTRCSLPEATRLIRDVDPPRLSSINTRFRGDIDTIVSKAIEKEVDRRYASASALAADLQRTLRDEPIAARPPSTAYQLRKFARRNRAMVAGVMATFLALVIGLLGTIYFAFGLSQQLEETERQRALAEQRFEDVRELANTFLFEVDEQIRDVSGTTAARETLVSTGLSYLDALAEQADDDHELLLELAVAYRRLGDIQGSPSLPNLGDIAGAAQSYQRSVELLEAIYMENADDERVLGHLTSSTNSLGHVQLARGDREAALEQYHATYDRLQGFRERTGVWTNAMEGDAARAAANVGRIKAQQGLLAEAIDRFEEFRAYIEPRAEQHPDDTDAVRNLATILDRIADLQRRQSEYEAALAAYRQAMEVLHTLDEEDRNRRGTQAALAGLHRSLGYLLVEMDRAEDAMDHFIKSRDIAARLAEADPDDLQARRNLGVAFFSLGFGAQESGHLDDAVEAFERYVTIADELVDRAPDYIVLRRDLRIACERLGDMLRRTGAFDDAQPYLQRGVEIAESLVDHSPDNVEARRELVLALENLAHLHVDLARREGSVDGSESHAEIAAALLAQAAEEIDRMAEIGRLEPRDQNTRGRIADLMERATDAKDPAG